MLGDNLDRGILPRLGVFGNLNTAYRSAGPLSQDIPLAPLPIVRPMRQGPMTFGSPGRSAAAFPPVAAASFSNLVGPRLVECRVRGGDGVGGCTSATITSAMLVSCLPVRLGVARSTTDARL